MSGIFLREGEAPKMQSETGRPSSVGRGPVVRLVRDDAGTLAGAKLRRVPQTASVSHDHL